MSLVTYILQSCDGNLKYRITFDSPTYLDVGETWNVECSGIQNGCYQVLDNTVNLGLVTACFDFLISEYTITLPRINNTALVQWPKRRPKISG